MIKPYYQEENITIYLGDCLEIIPQLEPVDLVLTDPPYPDVHVDDFSYTPKQMRGLDLLGCRQLVFWSAKVKFPLSYTAIHIWDKTTRCRSEYERIFERNGHKKYKMFRYHCIGNKIDAQFMKDIFTSHPTQKPRRLIRDLVKRYSVINQTIFDPFMGSGTTLVAAKELGRKAIGIDIEEKYCEIAVDRLRQEVFDFS